MLQHLYIQNYAIIDEIEIGFAAGMTAITGETGAGKSIIIGALNLILGERADTTVLVNKEKKCVVEGVFLNDKTAVKEFLIANDLDDLPEITVRREIATNGKTRAFINDTPVNLQQLQTFRALLIDLHRQFDTLSLNESDFQRNVLDALAGNEKLLTSYKMAFANWQSAVKRLSGLALQKQTFDKETDYLQFQFEELSNAGFVENELEDGEVEMKLLTNAEAIKTVLAKAYAGLNEGDRPIVQHLKSLANQLSQYEDYHKMLPELVQRIMSVQVELQDVASELDVINDQINYDAAKIEMLNERLSLGYKLQKKYGVHSTAGLLVIKSQLEEKLQAVLNIDEDITVLEKEVSHLHEIAKNAAIEISEKRNKQIKPFEKKVNELLAQVGMPNAALKVEVANVALNAFGVDEVRFLFDANKSGQFKPINKVASGGELSRLMLCIKSLVAKSMDMPTMIFDEIDSGISGEAAKQVGVIMKQLALQRQVVCITHQPQIAGKANLHLFVYKTLMGDRVFTNVKALNENERITIIAQMLSGEKPTNAALANAREMIMN